MDIFQVVLITATLPCSLVAGFLFGFAVVVIPGLNRLADGAFIRAFQVIDGIIQDNHPLFMLVWIGLVLALVASTGFGIMQLDGTELVLLIWATIIYLLGVQLPTGVINVPFNNNLQTLDVAMLGERALQTRRKNFEQRWNRLNVIRTVFAILTSLLFLVIMLLI